MERDECISCGYPKTLAPDLIHFDENSLTVDHCYFKKQPETPDEVERAIKAVLGCCCGSYRYAGDDPEIKKKLMGAG